LFVSCENPDFDASLSQLGDGLRHAVLQFVLDGRRPQQGHVLLDLLVDAVQLLVSVVQREGGCLVSVLPVVEKFVVQISHRQAQGPQALPGEFL
jgi:hypothetical protein